MKIDATVHDFTFDQKIILIITRVNVYQSKQKSINATYFSSLYILLKKSVYVTSPQVSEMN